MIQDGNGTPCATSLEAGCKHYVGETGTVTTRRSPREKQNEPCTDIGPGKATDVKSENTCRRRKCGEWEREGERYNIDHKGGCGDKEKAKTFGEATPRMSLDNCKAWRESDPREFVLPRREVSEPWGRGKAQKSTRTVPQLCKRKAGARRGRRGRRGNRTVPEQELQPSTTHDRRRSQGKQHEDHQSGCSPRDRQSLRKNLREPIRKLHQEALEDNVGTEIERFRSHRLSFRGAYLWETPSRGRFTTLSDGGRLFLNLFSNNRLGRAAQRLGVRAAFWILKFGEQYDVTHPVNLRRVLRDIADGGVLGRPPVGMLRVIAADHFDPVLSFGELKNPRFPCRRQIWLVLTQGTVSCGQ